MKETLTSNAVRSILVDHTGMLWMGIGSYGFIVKNPKTGEWKHYRDYPDFAEYSDLPTINTFLPIKRALLILKMLLMVIIFKQKTTIPQLYIIEEITTDTTE